MTTVTSILDRFIPYYNNVVVGLAGTLSSDDYARVYHVCTTFIYNNDETGNYGPLSLNDIDIILNCDDYPPDNTLELLMN